MPRAAEEGSEKQPDLAEESPDAGRFRQGSKGRWDIGSGRRRRCASREKQRSGVSARGISLGKGMRNNQALHGKPHKRMEARGETTNAAGGSGGGLQVSGGIVGGASKCCADGATVKGCEAWVARGWTGKDRWEWTWAENVPETGRKEKEGGKELREKAATGGLQMGARRSKSPYGTGRDGWLTMDGCAAKYSPNRPSAGGSLQLTII
jgi:hypothetical protein